MKRKTKSRDEIKTLDPYNSSIIEALKNPDPLHGIYFAELSKIAQEHRESGKQLDLQNDERLKFLVNETERLSKEAQIRNQFSEQLRIELLKFKNQDINATGIS